jgi:membrane associated rhomboid family serine protease
LEDPKAPYFLVIVTIIDIVLFIVEIVRNGGFAPWNVNPLGGPTAQTLVSIGAKYAPCIREEGQWWRFIAPVFLHGGIIHIVMNLFMQVRVGFSLERQYGALRIAPIYLAAGVMGNLMSATFLPNLPSVGASSALMGLVGLLLIDLIKNWSSLQNPCVALCEYMCQLLITLIIGLLPFVDNFAHIGGFIAGLLTSIIFLPNNRRFLPKDRTCMKVSCRIMGIIVAAVATFLMFFALFTSFYQGVDPNGWCAGCELVDCVPILDWCHFPDIHYDCY